MVVMLARKLARIFLLPFALLALPHTTLHAQDNTAPASARSTADLSHGWRFHLQSDPEAPVANAYMPGFDDSNWEQVSVPHSWNRMGSYTLERTSQSNNFQGAGWYRLHFDGGSSAPDLRRYLDFAAVGTIADVWVNGAFVGRHEGAFSRFRLDVTRAWLPGLSNIIAVRADNSKPEIGSSTEHIIPLAGDFFVHGGMYRGVRLIELPQASIDTLDYGGPGVYARALDIGEDQASIEVRTRLRNFGDPRSLQLITTIRDTTGAQVAQTQQAVTLSNGSHDKIALLNIADPQMWNGRAQPYLYSVTATLMEGDRALDSVTQPLGLRNFRVDADEGFFLNGNHLPLRGVSRHQDVMDASWALTAPQHRRDMELIAELGANSVRQAHYQHDDLWSDLADEYGMAVWAELAYVAAPSLSGGRGSPQLWRNAEQQLRELIRQNYNHPSIVMWSIGNEIDSAKAFGTVDVPPAPLELLQRLEQVAKEEDPTRPTVFADFSEQQGQFDVDRQDLNGTTNLIGYNRYPGWYYLQGPNAGRALGSILDRLHAANPALPMSVSEYGGGGAPSQHSDSVDAGDNSGFVNFIGRPQPEEYQSYLFELLWPQLEQRDYLFASWVWNMFDFTSDLRREGDSIDLNTKGLVTADRQIRKDAFYYLQAAWSSDPVLHLTGKRYQNRAYPVMDVKAYSNAANATLVLNAEPVGTVDCPNFTCVWRGVALRAGENVARVSTIVDGAELADETRWTGPDPSAQGIRIDAGNLATNVIDGHRFGSDTFVTGGAPKVLNIGSFGGRTDGPPRSVSGDNAQLFEYWREGDEFAYDIPLSDGPWMVTVHLLDPQADGASARSLNIIANGAVAVSGLNTTQAAGGALRTAERSFAVEVTGGLLMLSFASEGGPIALGAIELERCHNACK